MLYLRIMQVFISYAAEDAKWAATVAKWLARAKVRFFFDREEIYPGDNRPLTIGQALEASQGMVVLVSPNYVASEVAKADLQFALVRSQYAWRLFPVMVEPTPLGDTPWVLRESHIIDAINDPLNAEREFIATVKKQAKLLKKTQAAAALG